MCPPLYKHQPPQWDGCILTSTLQDVSNSLDLQTPAKCEVNMTRLSFHFLAPLILFSHPILTEHEETEG